MPRRADKGTPEAPLSPLPFALAPQLATLADGLPPDPAAWGWELKWDGFRLLARIEIGTVRLFTRNGHDWTAKMPELAAAISKLPVKSAWIDGEVIVMDHNGVPDFGALQNSFDNRRSKDLLYFAFDLPYCDGRDLRDLTNEQRREQLEAIISSAAEERVRFSEAFEHPPAHLVASACKLGFEGVIGKRRNGRYVSTRSTDWIKLKCSNRQEFVIGGFTDPKGSRNGVGSLILGVHTGNAGLKYAGSVGSGFSARVLADLYDKLGAIQTADCPFSNPSAITKNVHWVEPKLLAEVSFAEWTKEGKVRHAVFRGVRSDKRPEHIVREVPKRMRAGKPPSESPSGPPGAGLRVSNPERVIDKSTGITKMELVRYYATVAPLMLEHLAGRPVSLVRAPEGVGGEMFFQKHLDKGSIAGISEMPPSLNPGHQPLLEVVQLEGLAAAAQMNAIEFHTWNARKDLIGKPDRMTFDLDPGENVPWEHMQEGARLVRTILSELDLPCFLKTSGGKGLHVVVPIKRLHDWDTVKDFSRHLVAHLARTIPQRFVVKSGPSNRVGKIFVDYLRNGFGATTASAWTARARPGMGISVPVGWDELGLTSGAHWTVRSFDQRLRVGNSRWEGYDKAATSLAGAMKTMGFKPPSKRSPTK